MSAASVQLVRLISLKTAPRRTSSGSSSISESVSTAVRPSLLGGLGGRRRASSAAQVRQRVYRASGYMHVNTPYEHFS